jgi:hypothetical protein
MGYFPWAGKVYNGYLEELLNGRMRTYGHTHDHQYEESDKFKLRVGGSYVVQVADILLDVKISNPNPVSSLNNIFIV